MTRQEEPQVLTTPVRWRATVGRVVLACAWSLLSLACTGQDGGEVAAPGCPAYEGPADLQRTTEIVSQPALGGSLVEHRLDYGLRIAAPEGWQPAHGFFMPPEVNVAYLVGFVDEDATQAVVSITCTSGPVRMPGGSMFDATTPADPAEVGLSEWLRIELRSRLDLVLDRVVDGELSASDQSVALTTLGAVPADLSADPELIVDELLAGLNGPRREGGRQVATIPGSPLTVPSHFILTDDGDLVMAVGDVSTDGGPALDAADVAVATAVIDSISFGDTGCGCPEDEGPAVLR